MKNSHIRILIFTIMMLGWITSIAQFSSRMPLEIAEAYQKGTRSMDGHPGPNYWQNYSDYIIDADLIAHESILKGSQVVLYHNESPDTLNMIVIRLYQDFYKKGNARTWTISANDINSGTVIKNLKVGGHEVNLTNKRETRKSATNLTVYLKSNLVPGDSITLEMDWEIAIPQKDWNRMGNYGNDRFFLAYWYPQIAVYDDIDGWDKVEYYGTVEYYNDLNNFDVSITTPPGFTVWATGILQKPESFFTKKVLNRYLNAHQSDEIINIFTTEDCKKGKVLRNNEANTWRFIADNVPDFTFAASTVSNWDGTSTIADQSTGRRVFVDAVYPEKVDNFQNAAYYSVESVKFMVDSLPGYPFPYPHITSFCNGRKRGGMESPMMVNEGDPKDKGSTIGLIFHEILHTYFPFYMGINERKYAWMDEGWAAYLPYGVVDSLAPEYNYLARISSTFESMNGREKEIPLMYLSYQIKDYSSYRVHSYNRSAMANHFLRDALGDSTFRAATYEYIQRWNQKHPGPYDFFNTLEDVTETDLDWFIIPWYFNKSTADLAIKKVTTDNKIVIENSGGLPLPIYLKIDYADDSSENIHMNTSVWSIGSNAVVIDAREGSKISSVILGNSIVPDINESNNQITIE